MPTPAQTELAVFAVETILKNGVPAFMSAVRTLQTDEPTLEEIRALKGRVADPESYFGEGK